MNHIGLTCLVIVPWWALRFFWNQRKRPFRSGIQSGTSLSWQAFLPFVRLRSLEEWLGSLRFWAHWWWDEATQRLLTIHRFDGVTITPNQWEAAVRDGIAGREIRFMKSKRHGDPGICSWNMNERELVVILFDISVLHLKDKAGWSKMSACWPHGMILISQQQDPFGFRWKEWERCGGMLGTSFENAVVKQVAQAMAWWWSQLHSRFSKWIKMVYCIYS